MENSNQLWLHYLNNILAADVPSAVFLSSYLRRIGVSREFAASFEVIDLQKYKLVSDKVKVRIAIQERARLPFVFVVGKN